MKSSHIKLFIFSFIMLLGGNVKAAPAPVVTPLANQAYALCAGAVSFNFDGITYAKCRKKFGDSLGLTHAYSAGDMYPAGDIETVNVIGTSGNAPFIVSTYSPPDPERYALYSCNKPGAYAQCDGGICFNNTTGNPFPGLGIVGDGEIICSCPISIASKYHVWGPAECPKSAKEYDAICAVGSKKSVTRDGAILRIGNSGPVAVTKAQNEVYDRLFGTSTQSKLCQRPAN
jgi:hypothetical protein